MTWAAIAVWIALSAPTQEPQLTLTLVGNAGVVLSDGATSLLVDLPYEPGAFGYMRYDVDALRPPGTVISVITHGHRDHFDARLFAARPGWRVVGPASVVESLPPDRVLPGDSISVGAFSIIALATPHTSDHRSYRVRWQGRVLYFTGDAEDPVHVLGERHIDVLFITPWLRCTVAGTGRALVATRIVLYHLRPDGTDRRCEPAEALPQGSRLTLPSTPSRR